MPDRVRELLALAACAVAALAAAGCTSADEEGVRDTIARLESALREGDAAGVCNLYARGRALCRRHFGPAELQSIGFDGEIEVRDVTIRGRRAVARVENVRGDRRVPGSTRLLKVDGDWLLEGPAR